MWRSMSQRHRITLDKELMMDSEVKFTPEGTETRIRDLWSSLRLHLDEAMGKVHQRWEEGFTSIWWVTSRAPFCEYLKYMDSSRELYEFSTDEWALSACYSDQTCSGWEINGGDFCIMTGEVGGISYHLKRKKMNSASHLYCCAWHSVPCQRGAITTSTFGLEFASTVESTITRSWSPRGCLIVLLIWKMFRTQLIYVKCHVLKLGRSKVV